MIISFKIFLIEGVKLLCEISYLYLYLLKCKLEQKCINMRLVQDILYYQRQSLTL